MEFPEPVISQAVEPKTKADQEKMSLALSRLALFFFQAEDGIRDELVTGVQTCALPISGPARSWRRRTPERRGPCRSPARDWGRSEERRVGKSVDLGGRRIIQKKRG